MKQSSTLGPQETNFMNGDLRNKLYKKSYDYQKSENYLQTLKKPVGSAIVDETLKQREPKKLLKDWSGKMYLAPLTTVGNLPFRRICVDFGAEITCGEMAMATELLQVQ